MTEPVTAIAARAPEGDDIRNRMLDAHRQRAEATAAMKAAEAVRHEAPAQAVAEVAAADGAGAGRGFQLTPQLQALVHAGYAPEERREAAGGRNSALIISQLVEALRAAERGES